MFARVVGVLHAVLLLLPLGLFPLATHLKQLPQFVGLALQATGIQMVAVIQTKAEAEAIPDVIVTSSPCQGRSRRSSHLLCSS